MSQPTKTLTIDEAIRALENLKSRALGFGDALVDGVVWNGETLNALPLCDVMLQGPEWRPPRPT